MYFKGQGRQELEGKKMIPKTKGNKESKNYNCKNCVTTIFFPWGRYDWDRCHQLHVLMCTIDAITMEFYAPGLFHLQEPLKIKFSGKVYIFLDFFVWKFILILRYCPTVF